MATTTNYSWTTPDNTAYVKDGASAIRTLGSAVDTTLYTALGFAYPGLRLIKKQTIGSAVASVSVTDAFSATYENYKIIISGGVGSTTNYLALKLSASSTAYYNAGVYTTYTTTTPVGFSFANAAQWAQVGYFNTSVIAMDVNVCNPFLTKNTTMASSLIQTTTTGLFSPTGGYLNDSLSSTGFTITPASGTLTGGTIYVYGYGAS